MFIVFMYSASLGKNNGGCHDAHAVFDDYASAKYYMLDQTPSELTYCHILYCNTAHFDSYAYVDGIWQSRGYKEILSRSGYDNYNPNKMTDKTEPTPY